MSPTFALAAIAALVLLSYWMGSKRAVAIADGKSRALHSRPSYHGLFVALWCGVPALAVAGAWAILQPILIQGIVVDSLPETLRNLPADRFSLLLTDIRNISAGLVPSSGHAPEIAAAAARMSELRALGNTALVAAACAIGAAGLTWARARLSTQLRARNKVERAVTFFLVLCSAIAILTTIGIVLSLLFESIRFFGRVSPIDFLFGVKWSPQEAFRADQVGAKGTFGAMPLIFGTLMITAIAMIVAVPIGLMSAIYLSDYASHRTRAVAKPLLEILAGIPTVVFGFFAALTVAPFVRDTAESLGMTAASESALAAGLVMGVMIIPFVSSLTDDVINAVPQSLRDAAYGLGSTKSECIRKVVLPAALPGIFAAVLLAVSKAIGETMIVVMAAGLSATNFDNAGWWSPLESVTTITVQIVTLLKGDQEFDSSKTLSAFAIGLLLFIATLAMNIVALGVVRKYREKYD
ncbi:MAG: phosphate ABC transporter permease subunit PstC [Alphaproteobacteria bacterium]|nr:phosphate ABC transporter permease subunit PstC [Alphaproteobacteria bacterium]